MILKRLAFLFFILINTAFAQDRLSDAELTKAEDAYENENYRSALNYYDNDRIYTPYQYELFARCYDRLRDFENEAKVLSVALHHNKENARLYFVRADFFERMRNYEFSLRDIGLAIKFAEEDSMRFDYISERGWTKYLMNDLEGAIADGKEVVEIDSMHLGACNVLAIAYQEYGDNASAEPYMLKSYANDSLNYYVVNNMGYFYQKMKKYKTSLKYLNKAVSLVPENGLAYNNRGYTKLKLGDIEGALADVKLSIELYPNNAYSHRNRALIYIEMGKYKKACKDIEKAIGLGYSKTYGNELEDLQRRYCF